MSGVGRVRSRAIGREEVAAKRISKIFMVGLSATLLTFAAAIGLAAQDVKTEKPATELAMGTVSLDTPVAVQVNNRNWLDARVYAVHAGTRYRLGTVSSFETETFVIPRVLQPSIQAVQLLSLPIGSSRGFLSPEIHAEPGDVLSLNLEENLNLSSLYVSGTIVANR